MRHLISHVPIGEQFQANTQALYSLISSLSTIEDKMTSLIELTNSLLASNSSEAKAARKSTSYAWIASTLPSPPPPPTSTISPSVQQPPRVDSRESNAVLFGLSELT